MNRVSSTNSRGKFSFGEFQNSINRFQQDLGLAREMESKVEKR